MRKGTLWFLLIFVLIWLVLIPGAQAGQVVTKELRSWASKALSEEKALQAVAAENTVALLYFHNLSKRSELDLLQKGLAVMLITDLSKVEGLTVVERARLQALVEELKLGVSGLVEPGTAPRVGKLLGAYWLVGGEILGLQVDQLRLDAGVLEVPPQKVACKPDAEGILEELFRMEKELLFEILQCLKIKLTPEQESELNKPFSTSLGAAFDFFRGIEMSDLQNYKEASKYYEDALRQDPGLVPAQVALQELKSLGLIAPDKRSLDLLRSLRERTSLTDQLPTEDQLKRYRTPREVTIFEKSVAPPTPPPPAPPAPPATAGATATATTAATATTTAATATATTATGAGAAATIGELVRLEANRSF